MGANENFVPVVRVSGGNLEADFPEERVEVVADALIQAVELAAFLFGQNAVATVWCHQAGGKRCVDFFEEFEEDQAD